jgi:septin family protein
MFNNFRIPSCFSSKPEGYVGFGSLPDQVYRKAVRKGFEFNLMVVGESGLGKVSSCCID